jgi:signal transduction histidine kinase
MPSEKNEDRIEIHDFRSRFFWAIRIRYVILAVGVILLAPSFFKFDIRSGAGLVIFLAVYNAAAHFSYNLTKHSRLWQTLSLISIFHIFDISAITYLIYLTGWLESPYWFLYLVLIIVSGFGIFSRYSLVVFLIASFSAVFYLGLLMSAYFGIIPIYGPTFSLPPQELLRSILNRTVFTIVSFFLFASTIYYFSKSLSESQETLTEKNAELLATLEELKDIDRMKDDYVSTASHELRTPLAVIRENMSLIGDGVVGEVSEKQKKLCQSSLENVDRLSRMLDSLLDISGIESRQFEVKRVQADISSLAVKAIRLLNDMAEKKNILVENSLPEGAAAWIDPDQILRVFVNLLDNAIKYTQPNGKIFIAVENGQQEVRAYVKDNGVGIKEKDLPHMFERFVRIPREGEVNAKGAGLGLSICKAIIEMHRGRIWVESKPCEGTKFSFVLPKIELQ